MKPLPPSLYADTARPAPATPPFQGDQATEVAVIGGGFTGLSTALHLAEQGVQVTLLEANQPGWGASGRNGGQVNPGLKEDPEVVEARFGADLGRRMISLSYGAPDLVFDLIRKHQIQCEARQGGTLRAAIRPENTAAVKATAEQCAARGMPVQYLDAAGMRKLTGTDRYAGGMLDARGGDLQPLSYARGLAQAAQQAGARVHGDSPATALARDGDGWRITTPGGVLRAARVVLGTNGYTDKLWPGLQQSLVPVFSSIAATEPLPEAVVREILPHRCSVYESGRVTVYYRVDQQNRLLMGGRGPQREISSTAPITYLMRYAEKLWPQLRGHQWTHGWNGQLAMTQDHYPHVHSPAPGLFICLGYNGRGVALSTAMGRMLARHLGAGEALDMPVSNITPVPFHPFWRLGVTAVMVQGRVLDRLGL